VSTNSTTRAIKRSPNTYGYPALSSLDFSPSSFRTSALEQGEKKKEEKEPPLRTGGEPSEGKYYARAKVNGKQKWRTFEMSGASQFLFDVGPSVATCQVERRNRRAASGGPTRTKQAMATN
jgi:hypothetical protein